MKRTPWFNADVSPVRAGVYEWRCRFVTNGGLRQAVFDPAILWEGTSMSANLRPAPTCKSCQWRGLLRPAKEQK